MEQDFKVCHSDEWIYLFVSLFICLCLCVCAYSKTNEWVSKTFFGGEGGSVLRRNDKILRKK